jgi:iron complex outermembrane receptor protein
VVLFSNGDIRTVNSVFFNLGVTKAAGFDYSANYVLRTDKAGRFDFSTVWSMYSHYRISSSAGGAFTEVVNQATAEGTGSDNGYLRKKGRAQIEWAFKGFTTVFGTTYTDGFWDIDGNTGNDFFVSPTWIYDLQVAYNLGNRFAPFLNDTKVTLGVRNLFDRDPPFASGNAGNSTGYPGFLYSSEGRFVYLSVTRKF